MAGHVPRRVCVICRNLLPKADLIRLIRRPGGRIAWSEGLPEGGKGVYVCRQGDCVARMLGERKFRRLYVEPMEDECIGRLRALQPGTDRVAPFQGLAATGPKEGKA